MGNITMLPCTHCKSVAHDRKNWNGLTGDEWYCVEDVACQSRRMKQEQERAAIAAQEKQDENINRD